VRRPFLKNLKNYGIDAEIKPARKIKAPRMALGGSRTATTFAGAAARSMGSSSGRKARRGSCGPQGP
jgi:hypothetical protein